MAHYAFLDSNNIVTEVIPGRDEGELGIDWEDFYSKERGQRCLRTSYNTVAGQHNSGGKPYRKNYAGIGYRYDDALDAFIPPQPYPSWILDTDTCIWNSPVPMPTDGNGPYVWDESQMWWIKV